MGCDSALKREDVWTQAVWMGLENIVLSEVSRPQKEKHCTSCLSEGLGSQGRKDRK